MFPLEESQCADPLNPKRICKDLKTLILFIVLHILLCTKKPQTLVVQIYIVKKNTEVLAALEL